MVKKVEISRQKAEEMMDELSFIDDNIDDLLEATDKTVEDMAVEMYKCGAMFTRFAVINEVPFEHYVKTCVLMYERMGGVLEVSEDKVTDSHSVPDEDDDEEENKWLH